MNRRPLKGINGTREMPVHETVLFSKHLNAYYHNEVARSLMTLVMYEIVFCHFVLFSWSAPEQLPPGPSLQRKRHRLFSLSLRQSAEGGALGLVRDRNLSMAAVVLPICLGELARKHVTNLVGDKQNRIAIQAFTIPHYTQARVGVPNCPLSLSMLCVVIPENFVGNLSS